MQRSSRCEALLASFPIRQKASVEHGPLKPPQRILPVEIRGSFSHSGMSLTEWRRHRTDISRGPVRGRPCGWSYITDRSAERRMLGELSTFQRPNFRPARRKLQQATVSSGVHIKLTNTSREPFVALPCPSHRPPRDFIVSARNRQAQATMMDGVPLALKQADGNLAKCGSRAAQLNTVKPIVAYWCMEYSLFSWPCSSSLTISRRILGSKPDPGQRPPQYRWRSPRVHDEPDG